MDKYESSAGYIEKISVSNMKVSKVLIFSEDFIKRLKNQLAVWTVLSAPRNAMHLGLQSNENLKEVFIYNFMVMHNCAINNSNFG